MGVRLRSVPPLKMPEREIAGTAQQQQSLASGAAFGEYITRQHEVAPLFPLAIGMPDEAFYPWRHGQQRAASCQIWANDDALKLARSVRAALDKTAVAQR